MTIKKKETIAESKEFQNGLTEETDRMEKCLFKGQIARPSGDLL